MITWLDPFAPLLGLSHAPGTYRHTRSADLQALAEAGVAHIVCLQEADELTFFDPLDNIDRRRADVEALGMRFTHSPIEDYHAPTLAQAQQLVSAIRMDLVAERRVLVHCLAGLGRAGTIAACVLRAQGMSAHDAIVSVRYRRHGAIQSAEQDALIGAFVPES